MITKQDVDNLAQLARLGLSEEEKADIQKDLESILGYVGEIASVKINDDAQGRVGIIKNVMREDTDPYTEGAFTDKILEEAPNAEKGYIQVKKIL
jgi:aspartyl/glutamyl-tRNA(Asn/Gln) amidotransferase, C subunit